MTTAWQLQTPIRQNLWRFAMSRFLLAAVVGLISLVPESFAQTSSLDNKLREVCHEGNAAAVSDLLQRGANPNARDVQNATSLKLALDGGHLPIVKLLIAAGADGQQALLNAVGDIREGDVELLLEAGVKPNDRALAQACWLGKAWNVHLLLAAGANPDAGMVSAAQGRRTDILHTLRKHGGSVNAKGEGGVRPLHTGALQGGPQVVAYLLQLGADPNVVDERYNTPLHNAVSGNANLECVKLLVEAGARLNAANEEGITPVRLAAQRGAKDLYEWLLAANGNREPRPAIPDSRRQKEASTEQLMEDLDKVQGSKSNLAKCELIARGHEAVPEILARLQAGNNSKDEDSDARLYGVLSAMGPGAEAARPHLTSSLGQKQTVLIAAWTLEAMRPGALRALPLEAREVAAKTLYETVVAPDGQGTVYHLRVLVSLDDLAKAYLLKLLESDQPGQIFAAVKALETARFSDPQITARLLQLLEPSNDARIRSRAAAVLGHFGEGTPQLKGALLSIIKNPPPHDPRNPTELQQKAMYEWKEVADAAAGSLARFGIQVIDDLIPVLTPMESMPRIVAVGTLRALGQPAVPRLIELLAHEDQAVAASASVALNRIGHPAIGAFAHELRSQTDLRVVERVINAIGPGAKPALPALWDVARSQEKPGKLRIDAARTALKIDAAESRKSDAILSLVPILIDALEADDLRTQGHAAEALAGLGPVAQSAVPALRKRLDMPPERVNTQRALLESSVRENVEHALREIEPTQHKSRN